MKRINLFLTLFICIIMVPEAIAAKAWLNDLKTLYTTKQAIIYEINIRNFNAVDKNGNGIIEAGEEKGNFINAIKRLDELSDAGINAIKIMPVLPVSKTNALGTAGSLYAPVEFDKINPQLKSSKNSAYVDMHRFINACHKREIRVIVELPCCAGHDLYTKRPDLFLKDAYGKPISPYDMEDVYILNPQSDEVYNLYKNFVITMHDLDVDGISVSMPETKPASFWKNLISYANKLDPEMAFIADTNANSKEIFKGAVPIISKTQLLDAGFDGYKGDYDNIESIKNDLYKMVKADISTSQNYGNKKAVYVDIAPYDKISPTITKGADYSKLIMWITSVLPANLNYIDGFSTGDNYMYPYANKRAVSSLTDSKVYYMKRGQIDIYNFSRKPEGPDYNLYSDFGMSNKFKRIMTETLSNGNFLILKTNNNNVLSYARSYNNLSVILIANTEKAKYENVKIKVPKLTNDVFAMPMKESENIPTIKKGEILTNLAPYEVQLIWLQNFSIK